MIDYAAVLNNGARTCSIMGYSEQLGELLRGGNFKRLSVG